MKRALSTICIVLLSTVSLYACGDDDDDLPSNNGSGGSGGKAGTGGKSGAGGAGGGASGTGGSAGTAGGGAGTAGSGAGSGGTAGGGAGTAGAAGASGAAGSSGAAGAAGAGGDAGAGGSAGSGGSTACGAARDELLDPIDKVSTGKVFLTTVTEGGAGAGGSAGAGGGAGNAGNSGAGGGGTSFPAVFVDASAGGFSQSSVNPRVYISLTTPERVDVTDFAAYTSAAWDVALERSVIYANSGDAGPGGRTVAVVEKDFDDVVSADAAGATFAAESFFEADCTPKLDEANFLLTQFSGWYEYSDTINGYLIPRQNRTYLVRRSDNTTFKFAFVSYYTYDSGQPVPPPAGPAPPPNSGKFLLRIAPL